MVQVGEKEKQLNKLLNSGKYWGDSGAVLYFKNTFLVEAMALLENGKVSLAIKYIEVLDRAIMSRIKINFFQKIHTLYLLYTIQMMVKRIKDKAEYPYSGYTSEQLLVLLLASIHCLQVLKKMGLHNMFFLSSLKTRLTKDITRISEAIVKKAEDSRLSSSISLSYKPEQSVALLAEGALLEFTRKTSSDFILRARVYCEKNEHVLERDTLRTVCSLYRYLGEFKKALRVAHRLGSSDQVNQTEIAKEITMKKN